MTDVYYYGDELAPAEVTEREERRPDGTWAPTGYYPNVGGHFPDRPPGYAMLEDCIRNDVVVGALDWTEDKDQHDWVQVSADWTPPPHVERPPGVHDPLPDGPPPTTLRDLSLHYTRWAGASQTRLLDAPGVTGFRDTGTQDGISGVYLQDVKRTLAPYAPATPGGEMPDTLRWLPPGPAHGWTVRPAETSTGETITKMRDLVQQQPGRQELLANSTYAGQSYGVQTAHLVPTGSGGVPSRRTRG